MQPKIITLPAKKLVGMHLTMSLSNNRTGELWRGFMPRRKEIQHAIGTDLYSLQVYPAGYFEQFSPRNEFEKWALVEVTNFEAVPDGMETYLLTDGLYAVFHYQGSNTDTSIFQYIYATWLPGSGYRLDDRPHFEVLGERYRNNDPDSEEDIWIPICRRDT